jgi:hypothetical protein
MAVARVVAFVPDLLFGSTVLAAAQAGGHQAVLAGDPDTLRRELTEADALIVDLTLQAAERIELVGHARPPGMPTLAFYSHVEGEVRQLAQQAGFELVVPRSRMAREGTALIERLLAAG